uniref:Uncharacterized protein n=1 Tax=Anguilla anguilla TaxID=7936 RepID=A0A0E9RZ54_ANGAN
MQLYAFTVFLARLQRLQCALKRELWL